MDYPKRKQVRLKNYDYSQKGAYFVTVCTEGRQPILSEVLVEHVGASVPTKSYAGF